MLQILHGGDESLSGCIYCVSIWPELMSYVTSLTAEGFKDSSTLLSSFISPMCWCFGKMTSSELVFIIVHSRCTGNFAPKHLRLAQHRDFVVTYMRLPFL